MRYDAYAGVIPDGLLNDWMTTSSRLKTWKKDIQDIKVPDRCSTQTTALIQKQCFLTPCHLRQGPLSHKRLPAQQDNNLYGLVRWKGVNASENEMKLLANVYEVVPLWPNSGEFGQSIWLFLGVEG